MREESYEYGLPEYLQYDLDVKNIDFIGEDDDLMRVISVRNRVENA